MSKLAEFFKKLFQGTHKSETDSKDNSGDRFSQHIKEGKKQPIKIDKSVFNNPNREKLEGLKPKATKRGL